MTQPRTLDRLPYACPRCRYVFIEERLPERLIGEINSLGRRKPADVEAEDWLLDCPSCSLSVALSLEWDKPTGEFVIVSVNARRTPADDAYLAWKEGRATL